LQYNKVLKTGSKNCSPILFVEYPKLIRTVYSLKLRFSLLILILAVVSSLSAESAYLTFVEPESGATLQKTNVSLVVEKTAVNVDELLYVDTTKPSPDILYKPAARRYFVLLFDLIFNSPDELLQARKAAEAFLSKVGKDDLVAVAWIGPKDGLKWSCAFTTDRDKIITGMNLLGQDKPKTMLKGPDGNFYSQQFSATPKPVVLVDEPTFLQTMKGISVPDAKKREDLTPLVLQGLVDTGFLLGTIDGRKNILFFTNGFDTSGLSVDLGLQDKAPRKGQQETSDQPSAEHKDLDTVIDVQTIQQENEKAAAGPVRHKQVGVEALPDLLQGADAHFHIFHSGEKEFGFLKDLSEKTQGSYSHQTTDVSAWVEKTLASDQTFYVVGWTPNLATLKHLNTIKMEVAGKKISAAEKWLARKLYSEYSPAEKEMHIAASMYTDYGAAGAERFWNDFVFENDVSKIVSFVQMDGSDIIKNKPAKMATYELYSFTMNHDQSTSDFSSNQLELDLANKTLNERLSKTGIKVWNVLLGSKDTNAVRCVLVHSQTGDTISRSVPMQIADSELTMSCPFFPALNFDWILWPKPDQDVSKRGIPVHFPYNVDQNYFFPDLTPHVKKSETGRVFYVKFYNILPESKNPPISIFLVDSSGKSTEIQQFALLRKPNAVDHGGMELFWKLLVIPDVPPGSYNLKVQIRDTMHNKVVERQVPIEITL
jgi:hypothetical protein